MSKAKTKEYEALLEQVSEMFDEAGCVLGIDGEEVLAEKAVRSFKEIHLRRQSMTQKHSTIRRYGIDLGLRWSFRGWRKNGTKMPKTCTSRQ